MVELELEITDFGHGGVGIARHNDKVVFVRGALPGERVLARVTKDLAKRTEAVVTSVLDASEYRVEVPWPQGAAGVTGGADLAHASLDYQRELKAAVLEGAIRRVGGEELTDHLAQQGITVVVAAVGHGDGWHTRTRFDVVKQKYGFGMYVEGSNDVVGITAMPMAVRDLEEFAFENDWDETFRVGDRVRFVAPSRGENVAVADGVAWSAPGTRADDDVLESVSSGDDMFDYDVAADGFWQVHYRAPRTLLTAGLDGAQIVPGDVVLELFSGAGLFTAPLAKATGESGEVTAFEGDKKAVSYARRNLEQFPWARTFSRRIDARMDLGGADVIVADPPRKGLGIELAQSIAGSQARQIVLVSCDPASAARDVAAMVRSGRTVTSMQAFDIFPHTHHMEIVTVLS